MHEPDLIPQPVERRLLMNFLGFRLRAGVWCRGSQAIEETLVDDLDKETFTQYVQHWRQTRQRSERSQMERCATAVAYETLSSPRRLEAFQAESGVFKGLGASWTDIVESFELTRLDRGCFADSLAQTGPGGVKLLWQHSTNEPVGKLIAGTRESDRGLEVVGQVSRVQRFSDIVALARDGILALSIGFDPQETYYANDGPDGMGVRHIRKLKLWELSFCTFPASPSARVEEVYGRHNPRTQRNLARLRAAEDQLLRDAEVTAAQAVVCSWDGPQTLAAFRSDRLATYERQYQELRAQTRYLDIPEWVELHAYVDAQARLGRPTVQWSKDIRLLLFPTPSEQAYLTPLVSRVEGYLRVHQQAEAQVHYEQRCREQYQSRQRGLEIKYPKVA
jgi:HK97 family phage prohead protease